MISPASFVPLNTQDQRIAPKGQPHLPLRSSTAPIEMPESEKVLPLPDESAPKSLSPTFKDLYLQKREELRKGSEGMETMLVRQVLKEMRNSIPKPEDDEDLFGSTSHATQLFQQMMDDELANSAANHSRFGIAEKIFESNINQVTQEFAAQLASGQTVPYGLPLRRR